MAKKDIIPPHDIDLELSLLHSTIFSEDAQHQIFQEVKDRDFYLISHQFLFKCLLDLYIKKIKIDLVSLRAELKKKDELQTVGGNSYLAEIADSQSFVHKNVTNHIQLLKEHAIKRQLLHSSHELIEMALDDTIPSEELVNKSQDTLLEITKQKMKKNVASIKDVLSDVFMEMSNIVDQSKVLGISTGFNTLDTILSGLKKSQLVILAARPSVGKTSFAINLALNAAKANSGVLFFSLEMEKKDIGIKLLSAESCIDSKKIENSNLNETDMYHTLQGMNTVSDLPIYIEDTGGISTLELKTVTKQHMGKYNINLIIIDYLQLLKSARYQQNRTLEVSEIVRDLKSLSKELNIPILVLSQLNRNIEGRSDKTPVLSDLRETGEIEQTGDVIMFLNRKDYYDSSKEFKADSAVDLIIAKNRMGPIGNVSLSYKKSISKFYEFDFKNSEQNTIKNKFVK